MFLDLVNELVLVDEGVATARKRFVDTGELSTSYFEDLVNADPTKNKKYVEWMCKIAKEQLDVYEKDEWIFQIVQDFDRLSSKGYLENTDIYKYKALEEVETVLALPKNKEVLKKIISERELDVEKVLDNKDFLVVFPRTSEAMTKYGKGTMWCVTRRNDWEDYTSYGHKIYVVVSKKSLSFRTISYPKNSKFAVLVKINADLLIIYDDEDVILSRENKELFLKFMGFEDETEAIEKLFKPFTKKELADIKL